jgi:hypothetical protein
MSSSKTPVPPHSTVIMQAMNIQVLFRTSSQPHTTTSASHPDKTHIPAAASSQLPLSPLSAASPSCLSAASHLPLSPLSAASLSCLSQLPLSCLSAADLVIIHHQSEYTAIAGGLLAEPRTNRGLTHRWTASGTDDRIYSARAK